MTKTYLDRYGRLAEPPEAEAPSYDEIFLLAQDKYSHLSDTVQVATDPDIDRVDEGAWVQAWVWVPYPENDE
jgi:hypothetical protein